jgi:hypothetical protein
VLLDIFELARKKKKLNPSERGSITKKASCPNLFAAILHKIPVLKHPADLPFPQN